MAIAVDSAPTSTDVRRSDAGQAARGEQRFHTEDFPEQLRRETRGHVHQSGNRQRRRNDQQQRGEITEQRLAGDRGSTRSERRASSKQNSATINRASCERAPRIPACRAPSLPPAERATLRAPENTPTPPRRRRPRSIAVSTAPAFSCNRSRPAADVQRLDRRRHQLHRAARHHAPQRQPEQRADQSETRRFAQERSENRRSGSRRARARCQSPRAAAPPKPKSCCRSETRRPPARCNSATANSSETPPACGDFRPCRCPRDAPPHPAGKRFLQTPLPFFRVTAAVRNFHQDAINAPEAVQRVLRRRNIHHDRRRISIRIRKDAANGVLAHLIVDQQRNAIARLVAQALPDPDAVVLSRDISAHLPGVPCESSKRRLRGPRPPRSNRAPAAETYAWCPHRSA